VDYLVLDVETANYNRASICQIGLVTVKSNQITNKRSWLINPQCDFGSIHESIHGINQEKIVDAPLFVDVFEEIQTSLESNVVVHHGPFDREAIKQSIDRYGITSGDMCFLDNLEVSKLHWNKDDVISYKLKDLAAHAGFDFIHHDALQDALAAQAVFNKVLEESKKPLGYWVDWASVNLFSLSSPKKHKASKKTAGRSFIKTEKYTGDGKAEGKYFGKKIVFTGNLSIPRTDAAARAKVAGFTVTGAVSSKTNVLCIGIQDRTMLSAGHDKSSKQRKAEELIQKGCYIDIISEDDFLKMCPV